jgi:restriction system protein
VYSPLVILALLIGAPIVLAVLIRTIKADRERLRSVAEKVAEDKWWEEGLQESLESVLTKHHEALMARIRQTLRRDPYGNLLVAKALDELQYFFKTVVLRMLINLTSDDQAFLQNAFTAWVHKLDFEKIFAGSNQLPPRNNGLAYERRVASLLTDLGYSVSFTPESGDQGVDLIAHRQGRRIAVQCKDYQAPVGNDAVQQVFAGAAFYGAQSAFVIAPNGFTPAARRLAGSLGVLCGAHEELSNLLAKPA